MWATAGTWSGKEKRPTIQSKVKKNQGAKESQGLLVNSAAERFVGEDEPENRINYFDKGFWEIHVRLLAGNQKWWNATTYLPAWIRGGIGRRSLRHWLWRRCGNTLVSQQRVNCRRDLLNTTQSEIHEACYLSGTKTSNTAFSWTCQPNRKDEYPHSVNEVRKDLYVGVNQSLPRKIYNIQVWVKTRCQIVYIKTYDLKRDSDRKCVYRLDVRQHCKYRITDKTSRSRCDAGDIDGELNAGASDIYEW